MYLRAREDPAKLRVALASAFVLGRGRLSPAAVALGSGQRWGEKAGSARGFIGRVVRGIRKGSKWIRSPAMRGRRRWPSLHGRAIGGRRKENAGGKERKLGEEERKEGKGADLWGWSAAREKERG